MSRDLRAIVCYGDSNTWGSDPGMPGRLTHGLRWTTVLRHEVGPDYDVISEGLGGRTAGFDDPALPGRNGRDHLLACLWSHAPIWAVVIMLGTNDTKAVFHASATDIAHKIEDLVILIKEQVPGPDDTLPRILIVAPPPLGPLSRSGGSWDTAGVDESLLLAQAYHDVAERHGTLFLDAATIIESSRLDGVHLDADAARMLGVNVAQQLR